MISSMLSQVDINKNQPTVNKLASAHLPVVKDGKGLEAGHNTVILATKSAKNEKKFPDYKWSMMFFTQCNRLVIGWHENGELTEIERLGFEKVTEHCGQTAERVQSSVGKLVYLLQMVKLFALGESDGGMDCVRYSAICEAGSKLVKVYRWSRWSENTQLLPNKLKNIIYF